MVIRAVKSKDVEMIIEINEQQDFRLTNRHACITEAVADKNGEVIGYGIVKHLAEAIVLVDINKPKLTRMRAIRELMKQAIFGTASKGIPQLHVFVSDRKLADLLKKHYDFKETSDIVLVKNL